MPAVHFTLLPTVHYQCYGTPLQTVHCYLHCCQQCTVSVHWCQQYTVTAHCCQQYIDSITVHCCKQYTVILIVTNSIHCCSILISTIHVTVHYCRQYTVNSTLLQYAVAKSTLLCKNDESSSYVKLAVRHCSATSHCSVCRRRNFLPVLSS